MKHLFNLMAGNWKRYNPETMMLMPGDIVMYEDEPDHVIVVQIRAIDLHGGLTYYDHVDGEEWGMAKNSIIAFREDK